MNNPYFFALQISINRHGQKNCLNFFNHPLEIPYYTIIDEPHELS
jgi:hypothetical protein